MHNFDSLILSYTYSNDYKVYIKLNIKIEMNHIASERNDSNILFQSFSLKILSSQ